MSYIPLPTDISNNVLTSISRSQTDVVGTIMTGERNNTVITSFSANGNNTITDILNISTTGSGDATMAGGSGIFTSGTDVTSSIEAWSFTNVNYNPGFEVYITFSIAFTTPTSVNSSQFIGLWDFVNNGFYLGYNGTTFGIASMFSGSQTFVPRASWNADLLDGSATSKFTRGGVPEPINLTYLNLFRIRFSWWGSAPIVYEVMTPDGDWIVFHTIRQPNTTINPSLETPNLPIGLKITKTAADSTDLIMRGGSFAAGTTSPLAVDVVNYESGSWTSLTPTNTVVQTTTLGSGSATVSTFIEGTISGGVAIIEASADGNSWFALKFVPITNFIGGVETNINFAQGNILTQISTAGYLALRVRLTTGITGTGRVEINIRPSIASSNRLIAAYQPVGQDLHVVVDGSTTTTNSPTAISVGVTSTSVLSSNSLRKGLVLTNTSNRTISLGLNGAAAVLNSGITLQPGGTWIMDPYTFTTGAINAIASGAASNLAVQEFQ